MRNEQIHNRSGGLLLISLVIALILEIFHLFKTDLQIYAIPIKMPFFPLWQTLTSTFQNLHEIATDHKQLRTLNEGQVGELSLPNIKPYFKATVIKAMWNLHRDKHTQKYLTAQQQNIYIYTHLMYVRGGIIQGQKIHI